MILEKLYIQNFLSVSKVILDLRKRGLVLVLGEVEGSNSLSSNGAGKSNIFIESLNWLLYDELIRVGKRAKVKRRHERKEIAAETYVRLKGNLTDGRSFDFRRSVEKGYRIIVDGKVLTNSSKKECKDTLASLVGLHFKLFNSIVLMAQGLPTKFSGFNDSQRSSIVEKFIDAEVYIKAQERASRESKSISNEISNLTTKYSTLLTSINNTATQYLANLSRLSSIEEEVESELSTINSSLDTYHTNLETISLSLSSLNSSLSSLNEEFTSLKSESDAATAEYFSLARKLGELLGKRSPLEARYIVLSSLGNICSRCGSSINKELVSSQLEELKIEITDLASEIESYKNRTDFANSEHLRYISLLSNLRDKIHNTNLDISSKISSRQFISNSILELKSKKSSLLLVKDPLTKSIEELEVRLSTDKIELSKVSTRLANLRLREPYVNWWQDGYSLRGIRSWRIFEVLDSINSYISYYSTKIFDDELSLKLVPERITKSSTKPTVNLLIDSNCPDFRYESGGRSRRLDLIIHLALRKSAKDISGGFNSNLLVIDEIFDFVDKVGITRTLECIKDESESIFLISHDSSLQSKIPNSLLVKMIDDSSSIVKST